MFARLRSRRARPSRPLCSLPSSSRRPRWRAPAPACNKPNDGAAPRRAPLTCLSPIRGSEMTAGSLRDKGLVLLGAVALVTTLIGVVAVMTRYAFTMAISFSDELITYLIVWATLIAFGLGEFSNEHLRATVLVERLSPRWQSALSWLSLVLTLLFAAMLVYYGIEIAWQRHLLNEVSPTALQFPQWIARAAVPVGFGIACIALVARILRRQPQGASHD
ncbi:hypothetical protein CAL19_04715 [Bordetella genomosp. 7]|uniref:TRAP transporter small permease protein n=2 Tax=Alcaligenaceae TaxID=506 RepID=A0A261RIL5_9BORD|nr:hypothetical protein CAL19_04715 [Bordetella genomosp. 7]